MSRPVNQILMRNQRDPKAVEFTRLLAGSGLSQAEAARSINVTPGAVSQICTGKTKPRPSTLGLLRLVLAGRKRGAPARLLGELYLQAWERNLLADLRQLSAAERRALALIVKRMVNGPRKQDQPRGLAQDQARSPEARKPKETRRSRLQL
jgi:transcriptional regulator with XRE-family HTH domain